MERQIQDAKESLSDVQKRVHQHQQTLNGLDASINEIKIKCGRLGKVCSLVFSLENLRFNDYDRLNS